MSLNKKTYSSGDVITSSNLNEIQDAIIVNENNISAINTNINSLNTKVDNIQDNTLQTITIPASIWAPDPVSGYVAQAISCNGVTNNNIIIVSPNSAAIPNIKAYRDNNIMCVDQALNKLEFWAETCPTNSIKVDVLIIGGN